MTEPKDLAAVYGALGITEADHVSICYRTGGDDELHTVIATVDTAPQFASQLPEDVYFGLNPITLPLGTNGFKRGGEDDVSRVVGLAADLDIKQSGCGSIEMAHTIIDDVSALLNERPVVVIMSGGGLQPIWALEGCDPITGRALLHRFGRLVKRVAKDRGVNVDNVFDTARILRVPGKLNHKPEYDSPVEVSLIEDTGAPMTAFQVGEWLTEAGIPEMDDDTTVLGDTLSAPTGWVFTGSCNGYAKSTIAGWPGDTPSNGARHPWLVSQSVRLACMWRKGCLPDQKSLDAAKQVIATRFEKLCASTEPRRKVKRHEVGSTWDWAVEQRVSRFTDEQVDAELGCHEHPANDSAGQPNTQAANGGQSMKLWKAAELRQATQPKFLAKNRIPTSAITILIGEEGIGKSLLWVLIVAAITNGKAMPEFGIPEREPAKVILILTEDEWSDAVLPRLQVAGANLDNVQVLCTQDDGSGSPTFPDDMHLILESDPPPALVVCDAWLDTVPGRISVKDPQQSRQALHPWKEAAGKTQASMMLLTHSNRLETANIRDRYGASASLRQKARMTLYSLGDGETLYVGPDKSNGTARTKASIFRIRPVQHFQETEDHDGTVPLLEFFEQSDKTIREHLAELVDAERTKNKSPTAAELWLRELLTGVGRKPAHGIYDAGKKLGFSADQLRRAKTNINKSESSHIEVSKGGGFADEGKWFWELKMIGDCEDG